MKRKTYVLYHGNCPDGMGAYFAAWKALKDSAIYIPCLYGEKEPEIEDDSWVYFVDYSWKYQPMKELILRSHHVTILDHHQTAEAELMRLEFDSSIHPSLYTLDFDMKRSGAMITYNHFFPDVPTEEIPLLVKYVQDRDLWLHKLPYSKEINAAIMARGITLENFSFLGGADAMFEEVLVEQGKVLLAQNEAYIDRHMSMVFNVRLGEEVEYTVPCVNATVLYSDAADRMLSLYPDAPFVSYFMVRDAEHIQWGLRSRDSFDCSEIAKEYGGGGHKKASGFVTGIEFLHRNVAPNLD